MRANYQPSGGSEGKKTNGGDIGEVEREGDVSGEICKDQKMSLLPDRYFHKHTQQSGKAPNRHQLMAGYCADNH